VPELTESQALFKVFHISTERCSAATVWCYSREHRESLVLTDRGLATASTQTIRVGDMCLLDQSSVVLSLA
jgi:hypothetical protein